MDTAELISLVTRYINHSHQVYIHSTNLVPLAKNKKLATISFCRSVISGASKYSGSQRVSMLILGISIQLFEILPSQNNSSFKSSLTLYNTIIKECRLCLANMKTCITKS